MGGRTQFGRVVDSLGRTPGCPRQGWMAHFNQSLKLKHGLRLVFPSSADVTHPGGEVRHGDEMPIRPLAVEGLGARHSPDHALGAAGRGLAWHQ